MRVVFLIFCISLLGLQLPLSAQNTIEIEDYSQKSGSARVAILPEEILTLQLKNLSDLHKIKAFNSLGNGWISMRWKDIQSQNILSVFPVTKYGKLKPVSKMSQFFELDFKVEKKMKAHESIPLYIHTWGTAEEMKTVLLGYGISEVEWDKSGKFCTVSGNQAQIEKLSGHDIVAFIEPVSEDRTPLLNSVSGLMNLENVHSGEPSGLNLQGEGVAIGVWDYGLTGFHKDIDGQFINVENSFYNTGGTQHTTLVTGAIASKGILREKFIGVAPKSKVYVYNYFGKVIDKILSAKNNFNVFTTNHSYNIGSTFRCFVNYSYSTASSQMDQFAINEPQIVNLFAAGNSSAACAYDYKTIVPGFQYAKNVILVGNIQNNETFYPGSAKGPTTDGRLKPDVMAKGSGSFTPTTGIVLQVPTDGYTNGYGTSFAAPVVSGIVGLMQEAYKKKYGGMPLNTTVKAILCNTAKDLGNPGPDYDYGFGKADALEAVSAVQSGNFIEGSVAHGEERSYALEVQEGTRELKIFITWNDLPASLPNTKVLVNDIDLEVIAPDGRVYRPLVLNPNVPSLHAFEGRDSLNNSEQVVVQLPVSGTYTIKVKGYDVIGAQQDFSISHWTNSKEFAWNYPVKNSILSSAAVNLIRWRSNVADSVKIQYSTDKGENWEDIGTQSGGAAFYSWTAPGGHHSAVLLRALTLEDRVLSVSDTFIVSPSVTISSGRVCYDHIRIVWTNLTGVTRYVVCMLNEKSEWIEVAETTQNNYVFGKTREGKEYYFAVKPVFGEFTGIRSHALKVTARNNNTCLFTYKDVAVSSVAPVSGAIGTEYALTDNEQLTLKVINYANSVVNGVRLYYQVEQDSVREVIIGNMSANMVYEYTTEKTYDFSQTGEYIVRAWVASTNDVNTTNDTLVHIISQKQSVVAGFPYLQDFENTGDTLLHTLPYISLEQMPEWDYVSAGAGRISNFTSSSFSPNGDKALTIDAHTDNVDAANKLYLNIDLSGQQDSLVYLDYKQIKRGESEPRDTIFIQGSRNDAWLPVYNMYNAAVPSGVMEQVQRINLSEILKENGQQFSEHSVLKFEVNTSRTALTMATNGGYTVDDIKVYNGGVDLSLEMIDIAPVHCVYQNTLPIQIPARLLVKNNSPHTIPAGEVELYLKINDTLRLLEYNTAEILPYQQLLYEFSELLSFDDFENYRISAGIHYGKDLISDNNEILNAPIDFLKAIKNLPVELNFDQPEEISLVPAGDFYSWELGKPSKVYLYDVPDNPGRAWVTDLKNFYPANEMSYLYVGCLNPNLLTYNSELSFLMLYNIEYGADGLWLEFSYDGYSWLRMGTSKSGYNWYNPDHAYNIWDGDRLSWQTASFPLAGFVGTPGSNVFFRFAFSTSDYIQLEGAGIDNVRINNQLNARFPAQNISVSGTSTGNGNVELKADNVIYGYLDDKGQVLGNVQLDIVMSPTMPAYRDKFLLPRYYHLQTEKAPASLFELTLFNLNEEYVNYLNTDKNIRRMGEIGYLVYDGLNTDTSFTNNHFDENYTFYHPDSIDFWPYMEGYELRFSMDKQHSEIYLTSNLSNKNAYPFVAITEFDVYRTEESNHTFVEWKVEKEQGVTNYVVQYSVNGSEFADIDTVEVHTDGITTYLYKDSVYNISGEHYYRIIALAADSQYTSLIDSISFELVTVNIPAAKTSEGQFTVSYTGNGYLQLYWNSDVVQNHRIRIVDVSGKIIEEWKDALVSGYQSFHVPALQKSPSGMYFLQILDGNDSKSRKFVKSE